jgi:hypothetical protein
MRPLLPFILLSPLMLTPSRGTIGCSSEREDNRAKTYIRAGSALELSLPCGTLVCTALPFFHVVNNTDEERDDVDDDGDDDDNAATWETARRGSSRTRGPSDRENMVARCCKRSLPRVHRPATSSQGFFYKNLITISNNYK